jgi:hypothetical protein
MTIQPYEILLRWNDDGTFSGGHTIRRDPATKQLLDPQPLGKGDHPWPSALAEINTGLASRNTELEQAITCEKEIALATVAAAQEEIKAAKGAVRSSSDDLKRLFGVLEGLEKYLASPEATLSEARASVATALLPAKERLAAALRQKLAELES